MLHKRFVRTLLGLAGSALLVSCNIHRAAPEPGAIQRKATDGPLRGALGTIFRAEPSDANDRRRLRNGTVTFFPNFFYWSGDFDGDGRSDVFELDLGSRNWRLGTIAGTTLSWRNLGTDHRAGSGNTVWVDRALNEGGRAKVLSYQSGSQDWWFTQVIAGRLTLSQVTNTANYGDLLDGKHLLFFNDFDGDGNEDLLFNNAPDGNWFLGKSNGSQFTWSPSAINNSLGFGNLADGDHLFARGDFERRGRADILFNYVRDGNWFLGRYDGTALQWCQAGNTAGFGSLLDGDHILLGPSPAPQFRGRSFVVSGQANFLFHYTRDGHWFSASAIRNWPTCNNTPLVWTLIGDTPGFGNLLDGTHSVWLADFDGDGNTDVLFYAALDGNWWFSTSPGSGSLVFKVVSNTKEIGGLPDGDHEVFTGDFAQVGHDAVVIHSYSNASWWIGNFEGGQIHWCKLTEQTIP
jgi:hypothetical protein